MILLFKGGMYMDSKLRVRSWAEQNGRDNVLYTAGRPPMVPGHSDRSKLRSLQAFIRKRLLKAAGSLICRFPEA